MTQSATTAALTPGVYTTDPSHTHIGFVGRHLVVTKVRGTFEKFTTKVVVGDSPETSSVEASIDVASLTTRDQKRDEHLRSADFFNVEKYPTMEFRSTAIEPAGENRYLLTGDLTIRDQTHPVVLDVDYLGTEKTPWGASAAAVSASGEVDREQWGLTWNVSLESGGLLVSKKIQLEIEAELVPAQ